MTALLATYHVLTRLLEPAAPWVIERRLKQGKERAERVPERFGLGTEERPPGALLWLHGASVGESRLLLDLFRSLRKQRPHLNALVTTQTLTSADLIAASSTPGLIHQMAPVDAPSAVRRFLARWRPDAAIFAEGEIWPNMLAGLRRANTPSALVNARMTARTLSKWRRRKPSAVEVFSTFQFIGAADRATAAGLQEAANRSITVIGNLKFAQAITRPASEAVDAWRATAGDRPVLLAASTHPGEDEAALMAFDSVRTDHPSALLVIAPRHPERGGAITELSRARRYSTMQRSLSPGVPGMDVNVLVADTMGELTFWYAVADAVYLGGATAEHVGGHNALEAALLGKHVFTGPHGYNFGEVFEALRARDALVIGETPAELANYWLDALQTPRQFDVTGLIAASTQPFDDTVAAVLALIDSRAANA